MNKINEEWDQSFAKLTKAVNGRIFVVEFKLDLCTLDFFVMPTNFPPQSTPEKLWIPMRSAFAMSSSLNSLYDINFPILSALSSKYFFSCNVITSHKLQKCKGICVRKPNI